MKRGLLIAGGAIVLIVGIGAVAFWWWLGQPMYSPGAVAQRADLEPPVQPEDSASWQVTNAVTLRHFAHGSGRNVVVVHGGPGRPTQMEWPGLSPLAESYRFRYYDQRGCGGSSKPFRGAGSGNTYENIRALESSLGIGAQLADLERIRRILGDERLVLIGHSYGGFLAALYASEFPDRVAALVLVAPADLLVLPAADGGLFAAMRERLGSGKAAAFDSWLARYLDLGSVFGKSEQELLREDLEFADFFRGALEQTNEPAAWPEGIGPWMIRAQYFSMGKRHDYREALASVTAPVLVIHGAGDLQRVDAAQAYVDAFPNAELQTIDDAGHFPQAEAAELFAAAVSDFLERVVR